MRYADEPQDSFALSVQQTQGNQVYRVYVNNHRICGGKPSSNDKLLATWRFTLEQLQAALPELEITLRDKGSQ